MKLFRKKKHKYIARIDLKKVGKKLYRYFYDQDEYKAYLNGLKKNTKDVKKKSKSSIKKIDDILDSGKKAVSKFLSSSVESITKKAHKYVGKVKVSNSKGEQYYRYFYKLGEYKEYLSRLSETMNQKVSSIKKNTSLINKGKKLVDSCIDKVNSDFSKARKYVKNQVKSGKDFVSKAIDSGVKLGSMKDVKSADGWLNDIKSGGIGELVYTTIFDKIKDAITNDEVSDLKRKSKKTTDEEDQEAVNPKYNPNSFEYAYNCSYCTAAYDLRKRGYDVEASNISTYDDPTNINELASWYKGTEIETPDTVAKRQKLEKNDFGEYWVSSEDVEQDLLEYGEGARGHFCYYWASGGGHDVAWEVKDGEVVIRDCQNNQTYDLNYYMQYASDFAYFRTDNLELNDEVAKTVKNKKRKK